jgi:hypothetical protein
MKLSFDTNKPLEVCLMTLDGEAAESQYGGPQRKYVTTEHNVFYVSEQVGNIIAETCRKLRIEEREPVVICKAEVPDGRGRKAIRWQVTRVNAPPPSVGPQSNGGFAVDAQGIPPGGAGKISLPNTNGANGSYPPAPPVAPTTQVQQPAPAIPINGNGTANGGNGHAATPLPAERPKTKLEDALKTVADALLKAEKYAKEIGYEAWPKQFSCEDIRTFANTMLINGSREHCNGGSH